jgi:hypothetical protein
MFFQINVFVDRKINDTPAQFARPDLRQIFFLDDTKSEAPIKAEIVAVNFFVDLFSRLGKLIFDRFQITAVTGDRCVLVWIQSKEFDRQFQSVIK